jgi:hypothetical protein
VLKKTRKEGGLGAVKVERRGGSGLSYAMYGDVGVHCTSTVLRVEARGYSGTKLVL